MATTPLDDKLVPKTLALIDKYGKSVTFKVPSTRTYDPSTGVGSKGTITNVTRKITPPAAYSERMVDGEKIREGDMRASVAASGLTFEPSKGMNVEIDGVAWTVVTVKPVYSGESKAMWTMQLRN